MQPLPEVSRSSSTSQGEEGEGDTCTICFEPWTTAGQHRLSALRCGHLFGFTCILRWLKAQGTAAKCPQVSSCPFNTRVDFDALCWPLTVACFFFLPSTVCLQCNKKAKRADVVLLYAPRLKALDNSEQESLKR